MPLARLVRISKKPDTDISAIEDLLQEQAEQEAEEWALKNGSQAMDISDIQQKKTFLGTFWEQSCLYRLGSGLRGFAPGRRLTFEADQR